MKRATRITTILAAGLLVAALPALAQMGRGGGPGDDMGYGRHGGPDGPMGMHMGRIMDELDLTADQRQQLFGIFDRARNGEMGELGGKIFEARRALAQTIHNPDADEQQVQNAALQVSQLEEQMAVQRFRMHKEVVSILTDEQRAQLQQLLEERDNEQPGPPRKHHYPRRSR